MRFRPVLTVRSVHIVSALIAVGTATAACGASGSGSGYGKSASATHSTASSNAADSTTGSSAAVAIKVGDSSLGPILTDREGRTLYAFLNDKNGSSSCTGTCVATWPALVSKGPAEAGDGAQASLLSQTVRTEGTSQATYNKWPLYYYVGDTAAGDVDGQGLDGVWFAVGADGKLVKPAG